MIQVAYFCLFLDPCVLWILIDREVEKKYTLDWKNLAMLSNSWVWEKYIFLNVALLKIISSGLTCWIKLTWLLFLIKNSHFLGSLLRSRKHPVSFILKSVLCLYCHFLQKLNIVYTGFRHKRWNLLPVWNILRAKHVRYFQSSLIYKKKKKQKKPQKNFTSTNLSEAFFHWFWNHLAFYGVHTKTWNALNVQLP